MNLSEKEALTALSAVIRNSVKSFVIDDRNVILSWADRIDTVVSGVEGDALMGAQQYDGNLGHLNYLEAVLMDDLRNILSTDVGYNASWKKRGGVGAFMMLARKWDRLEPRAEKYSYDIFNTIIDDDRREGAIDDVRDLRRYLALVEAEMRRRGVVRPDQPKDAARA